MAAGKDTVYIDIDDEITNVIDKVKSSEHKIVALVLPKRAAVLQSVVNMKLLKRTAVSSKKNIVLITNEAGLLPLAAVAGLHVAKSLQSKPEIPALPDSPLDDSAEITIDDAHLDKTASVGELASAHKKESGESDEENDDEVIELDNVNAAEGPGVVATAKAIKKKHLKVPNFDRFRKGVIFGALGFVLLVIGWIFAAIILPTATVAINTNTSSVSVSTEFSVASDVQELDLEGKKIPATYKELKKTDTQKVQATGTKNNGEKATGTMALKNCSKADGTVAVPAGTAFSANSLSFVSNEAVVLPEANWNPSQTVCSTPTVNVDVTAQASGANYNLSARTYQNSINGVQASGSAMAGGTDVIIKIVAQSDVQNAADTMKGRLENSAFTALSAQLERDELMPLEATKVARDPTVTSSPAVGEEASAEVTVTSVTVYSMLGIQKSDLSKLVKKEAGKSIDTSKQAITNDGLADAQIALNSGSTDGKSSGLAIQTEVTAGPEIDQNYIKNLAKGKKKGEIERLIAEMPGVTSVEVKYSPFWVLSTPKAAKKIHVIVKKADGEAISNSDMGL